LTNGLKKSFTTFYVLTLFLIFNFDVFTSMHDIMRVVWCSVTNNNLLFVNI